MSRKISVQQYKLETKKKPRVKNAKKVDTPFGRFDSMAEYERFCELARLELLGEISDLQRQVPYPVDVNNIHVCTWIADFVYLTREGRRVVEDLKGHQTDVFKLKRKLVEAYYGFRILLTPARPMNKLRKVEVVSRKKGHIKMSTADWRANTAAIMKRAALTQRRRRG